MRKSRLLGTMVALAALSGAPAMAQDAKPVSKDVALSEADEASLEEFRTGLTEAFKKPDVEKLLGYLDDGVVVTWLDGTVTKGHDEIRAYAKKTMEGEDRLIQSMTLNPAIEHRRYDGNNLVSTGRLGDTYVLSDGKSRTLGSRFLAVLVKREGQWKIAAFHFSLDAFDNPFLSEVLSTTAWMSGGLAGLVALLLGLAGGFVLGKKTRG